MVKKNQQGAPPQGNQQPLYTKEEINAAVEELGIDWSEGEDNKAPAPPKETNTKPKEDKTAENPQPKQGAGARTRRERRTRIRRERINNLSQPIRGKRGERTEPIVEREPTQDAKALLARTKRISAIRNGRIPKDTTTTASASSTASRLLNLESSIQGLTEGEVIGRHNRDADEPWVAAAPSAQIPTKHLPHGQEFALWEPKTMAEVLESRGLSQEEIATETAKINSMIQDFHKKYTGQYGYVSNSRLPSGKTAGEARNSAETTEAEMEEAQRYRDKHFIDMEIRGFFEGRSPEQIAEYKSKFHRHQGTTERTDPKTGESVKLSYAPLQGTHWPTANESHATLPPEASWNTEVAGYPLSYTSNRGRRSRIQGYGRALRTAGLTPQEFDVAALLEEIDTIKEIASYSSKDDPSKLKSYVIPIYQKPMGKDKDGKDKFMYTTESKRITHWDKNGNPVYANNKHFADKSISEILDTFARSRYDGVMSQPADSRTLSPEETTTAVSGIYRTPVNADYRVTRAGKNALVDREFALDHADSIETDAKGKPIFENGKIKSMPRGAKLAEQSASSNEIEAFLSKLAMQIISSGQGGFSPNADPSSYWSPEIDPNNEFAAFWPTTHEIPSVIGDKYINRDSYIKAARKKLLANGGKWSPEIDPNNEFAAFWPTTHEMHAGLIKARDENMEEVQDVIKKALESTAYADYASDIAIVLSKAFMEQMVEEENEIQKAEMDEFMKADEEFKDKIVTVLENFNARMISLEKAVSESKSFSEYIDPEADKTHGTAKKAVTKGNHGSMADAHTTQKPIEGAKKEVNKFERPEEKEKELIPTPGQKQTASQKDPHTGIPSLNKAAVTPAFREGVKAGEMQAIKKMAESPEAVVSAKPRAIPETERMQVLQKSALPAISDEELMNTKNIGRLLAKKAGQM